MAQYLHGDSGLFWTIVSGEEDEEEEEEEIANEEEKTAFAFPVWEMGGKGRKRNFAPKEE